MHQLVVYKPQWSGNMDPAAIWPVPLSEVFDPSHLNSAPRQASDLCPQHVLPIEQISEAQTNAAAI